MIAASEKFLRATREKGLLLGAALSSGVLLLAFPPFHVVPIGSLQAHGASLAIDSAKIATLFFHERLLPATEGAADAAVVLAALAKDPASARRLHGRTVGFSSSTLFFVRGAGRVTAVEDNVVVVTLDGTEMKLGLATGMVFGDAVRDATGLLDANRYPNSQDFNDISANLNGLIEDQVTGPLRRNAVPGRALRFAGCFELEEDAKPELWRVIPVKVDWL